LDLTYLKTNNQFRATMNENGSGKPHFVVKYELVFQVIDRNLLWYAHLLDDVQALPGSQGQLSLSASFRAGTR
jgi:hypothetical protein